MPMMPMEPAKAVSRVRPSLVRRLLKLRDMAVKKDMEIFFRTRVCWGCSSGSQGSVSLTTLPSRSRTIRVE